MSDALTPEEREAMARVMALSFGANPDELIDMGLPEKLPRWSLYLPEIVKLEPLILARVARAVEAEREVCAQIAKNTRHACDNGDLLLHNHGGLWSPKIAAAIRARKDTT